ncbi:MAG: hypothetical protein ACTSRK_00470 [Promethearchaeota archaeon]
MKYYTKEYNLFTIMGWISLGILFLFQVFSMFGGRILPYDVYFSISKVLIYPRTAFIVLLVISYWNYVIPLPQLQRIIIMVLLGGVIIFRTVDLFVGINWGNVGFLKAIVKQIPTLILFLFYWKYGIMPKLISFVQGLRILFLLVLNLLPFPQPLFLGMMLGYFILLVFALIGVWFILGIPEDLKSPVTSEPYKQTTSKPAASHVSNNDGTGIYPPTSGLAHGVPRLGYWCENCQEQKKYRPKNNKDIAAAHSCPKCGTTLLSWWVEPTQKAFLGFVGGGVLVFGAMMTILFETNFGSYGLYPMILLGVLTTVETLIGIIIMYGGMKLKYSEPPSYATQVVSLEPQSRFIQEMIWMALPVLIGAAALYGINVGVISIFF